MKRLYLDYAASTPVDPEVVKAMLPYFNEIYGNPSSLHKFGQDAKEALNESRNIMSKSINAEPREIIFTSGGTESNNFAIKSVAFTNRKDRGIFKKKTAGHIITTKIEHDCVLNTCKWLEEQGFDVTYLDVDSEGFISTQILEKEIRKDTILVSVIHGNNEIGTIQNLKEIGSICKKHGVYFHSDACQSYTKVPIDVKEMNIDLLTINAHKIYGPKGVGALYIKKGTKIKPWQHGGGHEFGMRSGTENTPGIVGFAKAAQLNPNLEQIKELQKYAVNRFLTEIKETKINGPMPGIKRLPNNINLAIKGIEGEALLTLLDEDGIAALSTASACSSNTLETSHVLKAIGLDIDVNSSIRLSIGRNTKKEELDKAIDAIKLSVDKLRGMSPFWKKEV